MSTTLTPTLGAGGTRTLFSTKIVVAATAFGVALNWVLEIVEATLLPAARDNLVKNLVVVLVFSVVGCLATLVLLRLGGRRARPVASILLAVLGLVTVMPMFWCAVPGTLAAGGWSLARPVGGTASRIGWLLSILAFVSFVAVSVGMFPFADL